MKRILTGAILLFATMTAAQAVESPAPRTLVLVRHGHYAPDPTVDEKSGPGLSPLGVAQARLAGARLASLFKHFDALYSSPMQRARDTAAIIAADIPGQPFSVVGDLAECTPPARRSEIMKDEKPEDTVACKAQLDRLFERYFRPAAGSERTELFVCHGNVTRYLVTRALGVDSAAWLEMSFHHASITTIRVEADGRFKVIGAGDSGHLPASMLSGATGDVERSLAIPRLPAGGAD